ncbi:BTAD domain-containing putative transcriptional regulator [Kribbella sp. NPDC058693]|uniref:AfsR/SARP family transcriptional regulator n=1 Tax=Kribbella sp. NPDC058693 TaxID=3346602 RepID=UPI00365CD108
MDEELRFTVLGPVRAWRGEREVELGSRQPRAVLAALLLHEGTDTSIAELVDVVWGGGDIPPTGTQVIRTYVHRLRRALEPGQSAADSIITSTTIGYRLRTDPASVDLGCFQQLLAVAEAAAPVDALDQLRRAIALWTGPVLAGIPGDYAESQRVRLNQLRLTALERQARLQLELGAVPEALAGLTGLVDDHPFDERFAELLMLALYASGRQAEALAVYRRLRSRLAEELGTNPGQELRTLQDRIIRADPDLLPSASTTLVAGPAQLPADHYGFAGRQPELAAATAILERPDREPTVLVTGMAGVGKTTFAVHWAHAIADRFPDGQLYLNLRGFDPARPAMPTEEAFFLVLEALGVPPQEMPKDLDGRAATYERLLANRRILVLLDNARDAEQVAPLLVGTTGGLFVVTSRHQFGGSVRGAVIALDVLPPVEAIEFLGGRLGDQRVRQEQSAAAAIAERCGRLPLALAVVAARAALNPAFRLTDILAELDESLGRLDAFADADVAVDVRAVFSWSYRALPPPAAAVFRLMSELPWTTSNLVTISSLAGGAIPVTEVLVAELTAAHLLLEPVPGRFGYHDLVRAYAMEQLEAVDSVDVRRAALVHVLDHFVQTAKVAEALVNPHRPAVDIMPRRPETLVDDIADRPSAWAWFIAEYTALVSAVRDAARNGYDEHAWQLAWALDTFQYRGGHWREAVDVQRTGLAAAERMGDMHLKAVAQYTLGKTYIDVGERDAARDLLEKAVAGFRQAGSEEAESSAYVALGNMYSDEGRSAEAVQNYQEALRHGSEPIARATAMNNLANEYSTLGDHELAVTMLLQAIELWQAAGDRHGEANSWDSLGHAQQMLGDLPAAATWYLRAIDAFRELGDRYNEAMSLANYGDNRVSLHDLAAAREAWQRALELFAELRHPMAGKLEQKLSSLAG